MVKFREFIHENENDNEKTVVPYVYTHINNGGVQFKIVDNEGPQLIIRATHFENQTNEIKLFLNKDSFSKLSDMFKKASNYNFSHPQRKYSSIGTDDILIYNENSEKTS